MPAVHLIGGVRQGGAKTTPKGNTTVSVNDKLWAVEGDEDDAGGGALKAANNSKVFINDKPVIVKGDPSSVKDGKIDNPGADDGSSDVSAGS